MHPKGKEALPLRLEIGAEGLIPPFLPPPLRAKAERKVQLQGLDAYIHCQLYA